ncbi:MAG TPA: glycoside hydrolase family 97 protein [Pelobium sp.]|nr:glycoside hydrolase family 97 protein [Pelobium sp.]
MRFNFIALLVFASFIAKSQTLSLKSPDNRLNISIELKDSIAYSVAFDGKTLFDKNKVQMQSTHAILGLHPKLKSKEYRVINENIKPIVPLQDALINNHCNVLQLNFKGGYGLEFRAYNGGLAYRFITSLKDSINIVDENVSLNFTDNYWVSWANASSFKNDYQVIYDPKTLNQIKPNAMSTLPLLFKGAGYSILFSEANLFDYPAMFLKSKGSKSLKATFPKVPLAFGNQGDRSVEILKEANYIARTTGKRSFPWRFMVISKSDGEIAENNMVAKLSEKPNADFSWVKPGQVTWEWWHNAEVYGVDFKSGYNQNTYKYYIDFASAHGIPYVLMDEGWAKSTMNPFDPNPTINLHELIKYGETKNVKIILWFTWLAVEKNFSVFKTLHDWGIAGMKVDFMDRSDQWMVNYYERVAKEAAKHKIFIDFHGAFKPAGLEVKYPNVLSYEGVMGMEANISGGVATPNNNLYLPFVRNAVGAMDYTPGAMKSAHPKDYRGNWTNTMSIGTRAHQLAMYIVFKSGLQMLADNPFNYLKEKESLSFINSVPVTWDETRVLKTEAPEYIVLARRKGDAWFVGGMTNSKAREFNLPADFLKNSTKYKITIIKDGMNADVQAMDYKQEIKEIQSGDNMHIKMVADGGWVAKIEPN